ncbi:TIGR01212 family radical SAM protein [Gammaproteobacteria bacterium]|nr:TIGR01212 family radical SAM protein [Gammaproteobacteria bacterium]
MLDLYNNYNHTLRDLFGERIQKISINAGFTCPNRDGKVGVGGCTFCNNLTFHPNYCVPDISPLEQLKKGMTFFKKYPNQLYMPYFQAYTNTYAPLEELKRLYEPLLQEDRVVGLVIGTRPDCVDERLLDYFGELATKTYVMLEYGVESTLDTTLERVNRGHDFQKSIWAIEETAKRGIHTGAHMILGLPGESQQEMLQHADKLSPLPLDMLKLHQLQIVKGTKMAQQYIENPESFSIFSMQEYIDLICNFLERLNPNIGIERFVSSSPDDLLIAPDWGIKNFEFVHQLEKALRQRI